MALKLTRVPDGEDVWGRTRIRLYDVQLDNSYPNPAGYVIKAGDVGLKFFHGSSIIGQNKAAAAVDVRIDTGTSAGNLPSSVVLRAFAPTGGTAPSSLAPPSFAEGAVTIGGTATGTIPAGATPVTSTGAQPAVSVPATGLTGSIAAGAGTGGIGVEFANGTDLSTLSVRVEFRGQ